MVRINVEKKSLKCHHYILLQTVIGGYTGIKVQLVCEYWVNYT